MRKSFVKTLLVLCLVFVALATVSCKKKCKHNYGKRLNCVNLDYGDKTR